VIVGIQTEDINMLFGHGHSFGGIAADGKSGSDVGLKSGRLLPPQIGFWSAGAHCTMF
jgi:hypothetical protein